MKRIAAIINLNDDMTENMHNIIDKFFEEKCIDEMYVFSNVEKQEFNISTNEKKCMNICFPSDCDNIPKKRNWLNKYFKTNQFDGFLHVLEDNTEILTSPLKFINELEHMMSVLDYDVWFSTVCDRCNYIYQKYNPRLSVELDRAEYFKLELGQRLIFTSHSNTQWIAYNFAKVSDDLLRFDEDFSIAMFFIIEYLARRRNTKSANQLYFMNQYLTVESENGVFKTIELSKSDANEQEKMKTEDQMFKEKHINFEPDNNIDLVLETVYNKINEKLD